MSVLRKIGRILLLIGGIFGLLDAVGYFFMIIGGAVCAVLAQTIAEALAPQIPSVPVEQLAMYFVAGGAAIAVLSLFLAVFSLVLGILGIKAFKVHEKKLYIENIVFSVLAGFALLPLVGAILGLIALAKEKKAAKAIVEEPLAE